MENKKLLISALALVFVTTVTVGATYASQGGERFGNEEVHTAIEASDYSLVPVELQEKITEEKFSAMIARKATMEQHKAELESVVQSNDFSAFQAIVESHRAEMEANRPEGEEGGCHGRFGGERPELTDEEKTEKLQEKFTKLTEWYAENGELPERNGRKGGMRSGKRE